VGIVTTAMKARAMGMPLRKGPGRKFILSLFPPLAAGAVLTMVLFQAGMVQVLPGMWLLLFGVGIVSAGSFSVRVVPVMGMCFMALGVVALCECLGVHRATSRLVNRRASDRRDASRLHARQSRAPLLGLM